MWSSGRKRFREYVHSILFIAIGFGSEATVASCVSVEGDREFVGSSLGLTYDDDAIGPLLDEAIAFWSACENYRADFPFLIAQGRGTRTVHIRRVEGSSDSVQCGAFKGREIVLYTHAMTPKGRLVPCGSLGQNLAHEIGHVLGLGHTGGRAECRSHIMAQLHADNAWSRAVQPDECGAVGRKWETLTERWRREEWGRAAPSLRAADRRSVRSRSSVSAFRDGP